MSSDPKDHVQAFRDLAEYCRQQADVLESWINGEEIFCYAASGRMALLTPYEDGETFWNGKPTINYVYKFKSKTDA